MRDTVGEVAVRRGDFVLDVMVPVAPGEVVAVLGRNGSGKSTVLAAVAGLLCPDTGRIVREQEATLGELPMPSTTAAAVRRSAVV